MKCLVSCFLLFMPAFADPPSTVEQHLGKANELRSAKDPNAKLEAVRWFELRSKEKDGLAAVPVLEALAIEEADVPLRCRIITLLASIAREAGQPCPLVLLKLHVEGKEDVRWTARDQAYFFQRFPEGTAAILLKGLEHRDSNVRDDSLLLIAKAMPKDARTLPAIEKALGDPSLEVRNSAQMARFKVTDRIADVLPYLIRLAEASDEVLQPIPNDPNLAKKEREFLNVLRIGTWNLTFNWRDKRADEYAEALLASLKKPDAVDRLGAASLIANGVFKPEKTADPIANLLKQFQEGEPKEVPKREPEPSALAEALDSRGARMLLQQAAKTDPTPAVRNAAQTALERLDAARKRR